MTRFYFGAITPLNVSEFSLRELSEYLTWMDDEIARINASFDN